MTKFNVIFMQTLLWSIILAGGVIYQETEGRAGVFNLPHFVTPNEFAIGVEPELVTTGSAAMGVNLKYTQGLTDLNNFTGIIGTGAGNRGFRVGGSFTFDFFPDIERQPGIGVAIQGLFVQLPNVGSVETTAIPYVHKAISTVQGVFEPYFALPVGLSLSSGTYQVTTSMVLGSLYQLSKHLSTDLELGVSMNNAYTYVSGGLIYYH